MTARGKLRRWVGKVDRLMLLWFLVGFLFAVPHAAEAAVSTTIKLTIDSPVASVNGQQVILDTAPVIDAAAGRTFVPVRFIGENLGAYIGWDGTARKVTYLGGDTRIDLWIGRKTALVNGREMTLDAAPYIDRNGRTLVPVRFVSEAMGASVAWDGATRTVTITAPWVGRVVLLQNEQYSPASLTVAPGTRITWVNLDNQRHDVVGDGWGSDTLQHEDFYAHTFDAPGSYDYGCSFHVDMTGVIIVE